MINAKTEISNLQDDIKIVQDDIKKTEIFLDDVLDKKKGELDKHADSLGLKLITDLKGGLPDLIATDNCIDYQWDFRNKAGKGHWWTCPDGRVMIGFQYGSGTNPPSSWEPILKCCRLDFRKQG